MRGVLAAVPPLHAKRCTPPVCTHPHSSTLLPRVGGGRNGKTRSCSRPPTSTLSVCWQEGVPPSLSLPSRAFVRCGCRPKTQWTVVGFSPLSVATDCRPSGAVPLLASAVLECSFGSLRSLRARVRLAPSDLAVCVEWSASAAPKAPALAATPRVSGSLPCGGCWGGCSPLRCGVVRCGAAVGSGSVSRHVAVAPVPRWRSAG